MQEIVWLVNKKVTSENLQGPHGMFKNTFNLSMQVICIILLGLNNSGQGLWIISETSSIFICFELCITQSRKRGVLEPRISSCLKSVVLKYLSFIIEVEGDFVGTFG